MDEETTEPKDDISLYRFEYLEEDIRVIDWLWLTEAELERYLENFKDASALVYRVATSEEEELYDEAYRDGYEVAAIQEIMKSDNGITFRLDNIGEETLETTKMFECGICGEHKDFDSDVATANGFYVSISKEDILWHVCFQCTMLELSVD